MKKLFLLGIFFSFMVNLICVPQLFSADWEWTTKKQLNLEAPPLDISTSADGRWIFILAPGEVLVYSISEDKVVNHTPVDWAFNRLTHSAKNNTLILSSLSEKRLKVIQLELIHKIDISGLPFKGPDHAPITIAVFGDYQ